MMENSLSVFSQKVNQLPSSQYQKEKALRQKQLQQQQQLSTPSVNNNTNPSRRTQQPQEQPWPRPPPPDSHNSTNKRHRYSFTGAGNFPPARSSLTSSRSERRNASFVDEREDSFDFDAFGDQISISTKKRIASLFRAQINIKIIKSCNF